MRTDQKERKNWCMLNTKRRILKFSRIFLIPEVSVFLENRICSKVINFSVNATRNLARGKMIFANWKPIERHTRHTTATHSVFDLLLTTFWHLYVSFINIVGKKKARSSTAKLLRLRDTWSPFIRPWVYKTKRRSVSKVLRMATGSLSQWSTFISFHNITK